MSEFDRRLHHAARELRERPVDVPPLAALGIDTSPRRTSQMPAVLAASVLVLGGLVVFATGRAHFDQSGRPAEIADVVAVAAPTPTAADRMRDPIVRRVATLSPHDEIVLVSATRQAAVAVSNDESRSPGAHVQRAPRWS
jgi:hypothetical protein